MGIRRFEDKVPQRGERVYVDDRATVTSSPSVSEKPPGLNSEA